jgi:ribose/xylose/arabinose/galactoside ABC-type transport system permease subunit
VVEFSNLGIVFGVVWNMTVKPGFGESLAAVLVGYAVGAVTALLIIRSSQEELVATAEPAA